MQEFADGASHHRVMGLCKNAFGAKRMRDDTHGVLKATAHVPRVDAWIEGQTLELPCIRRTNVKNDSSLVRCGELR